MATSSTPRRLFAVNELDDEGYQVAHLPLASRAARRSRRRPTSTSRNYPDWLYLIVSLEAEPVVRAWWIGDGRVEEEELDVIDG